MTRTFPARRLAAIALAAAITLTTAVLAPAAGAAPAATAKPSSTKAIPAWSLISGQLIHSGGTRCALGFNARRGAGRYIVTSGLCASSGGDWYGVGGHIGPSVGSSFPGNNYGLIQVASAAALSTPLVDRYSAGVDVTITGFGTPPVGSSVCYSSPTSGWRCGSVTALNQTVCYPEGCMTGLIRTTLCPEPGSSGAPVVTNPGSGTRARAVGLIAGGSGNCTSGGTTWVQPIAAPLAAYGLTLVTG